MFISFYDKDFVAINNNSSLNIEKYTLSRKSYALNDFSCTCEPVDLDAEPMFGVMRDNTGKKVYDCIAPIVTKTTDSKSTVKAKDLKSIFSSECLIDFDTFTGTTVAEYLTFIFNIWKNYINYGFPNINFDVNNVTTTAAVEKPDGKQVYNVFELFSKIFAYYGLYMESSISIKTQELNFTVGQTNTNSVTIRLEDYGITNFNKTIPKTNVATAMTDDYTLSSTWYLLSDGTITDNSLLQDIFPASNKIVTSDTIGNAKVEAVMELAENRNYEDIELSVYANDRLYDIDFNVSVNVYYNKTFYKTLPIGTITDTESNVRKIKLGYLPLDFIKLIK